jgi:hypothetical protein
MSYRNKDYEFNIGSVKVERYCDFSHKHKCMKCGRTDRIWLDFITNESQTIAVCRYCYNYDISRGDCDEKRLERLEQLFAKAVIDAL